jgi:hypothetical protein
MYFFVNRTLIQDESDLPTTPISAELHVTQAKFEAGFSETAVVKHDAFARDLLDYNRDVNSLTYLNEDARDAITRSGRTIAEYWEASIASQFVLDTRPRAIRSLIRR